MTAILRLTLAGFLPALIFGLAHVSIAQAQTGSCPAHASAVGQERSGNTIKVICECDAGYFNVDGQCLSRNKARAELKRQLEFKAIAYQGAIDRVKHTANAFGFHIDAAGYGVLRDIKPKLPHIVGGLAVLAIYKNPKTAVTMSKKALAAAVSATAVATLFVTDLLNDCNFANYETKSLCKNFRLAVLDLQPRIDAFTAAREELERLY